MITKINSQLVKNNGESEGNLDRDFGRKITDARSTSDYKLGDGPGVETQSSGVSGLWSEGKILLALADPPEKAGKTDKPDRPAKEKTSETTGHGSKNRVDVDVGSGGCELRVEIKDNKVNIGK